MTANLSAPGAILDIDIALIDVPARRRKLDPVWVEALSDLFGSQGQQAPIEVIAAGERFRLVFGNHRLAAAKLLGWGKITASVKAADAFASEAELILREIAENFARRELSILDRAVDIARWREVYEATHLVAKPGRKAKAIMPEELTAKFAVNFSVAAQKAFGLSERSIFNAVKIASIDAELRDRIALLPVADNQSDLLLLASQSADRREAIVDILTDELTDEAARTISVADAIAILDRVPKPAPVTKLAKLSATFSALKEREQDAFFELQEAAIRRWLKARGG